jgi:hypothetical protein
LSRRLIAASSIPLPFVGGASFTIRAVAKVLVGHVVPLTYGSVVDRITGPLGEARSVHWSTRRRRSRVWDRYGDELRVAALRLSILAPDGEPWLGYSTAATLGFRSADARCV